MILQLIIILATIAISGILWHIGGQGKKWARQCVGGVIATGKGLILWSLLSIWVMLYWVALLCLVQAFSYGLNTPLHKFWVWVFGKGEQGDCKEVEIATRATCGFLWSLAAIVFAMVTGGWINQLVYTVSLSLLVAYFGLQPNVKVSEIGTGCSVALSLLV